MSEALLAARLLAAAPAQLGGIWLRGEGTRSGGAERDAVLAFLKAQFEGRPVCRLPVHIDEERLCGGIDVAASLSVGHRVEQTGLLQEVEGGLLIVPMAERLNSMVAGRIAQAMDAGAGFALVLIDDGGEEEVPPVSLTERVAFWCDFSEDTAAADASARTMPDASTTPASEGPSVVLAAEHRRKLAALTLALGIDSARAMLFAQRAAALAAQCAGRAEVQDADLESVARLVLGPRATRLPPEQPEEQQEQPAEDTAEDNPPPPHENEGENQPGDTPPPDDSEADQEQIEPNELDDLVLAAALASIPKDVLARIGEGRPARSSTGGGGAGRKRASKMRGRPLGARPGLPRGGARLALIDTLRTAVPWQEIRRQQEGMDAPKRLRIRKGDLRIRRFEERAEALTIFAVDASGSSALARLAEAKGAVELMLAQSYVKRAQVALIAFRGTGAELLLPPTRSLTRAKKVLGELPGGGGTPLALGIAAAAELAEVQSARGRTPFVAVLTDGKGNIDKNGQPGRPQAGQDALAAARRFALSGTQGVVIDISARPQPEAAAIAAAMHARYLALPRADARGVERAVSALQFGNKS